MKVAVVGATGMVGQVMLDVLSERNFKIDELILVASERSVGKQIKVQDKTHTIKSLADAVDAKPDIALFSAGGNTSLEWAPKFAAVGTKVIDNSSAWRMHKDHKLIIPEINANELTSKDFIIANPNCSTIQLLMVLKPLHDKFNIKRVVVSTYQSITGTGLKAVKQLEAEANNQSAEMAYAYQIHKNAIPHCDVFLENDYTKEEMKLTNETKKILGDQNLNLVATAVRIPVVGGHSESVNIEFENAFDVATVKQTLKQMPGVTLQDNPDVNTYPMPIYAEGKDDVFVGRIRRDFTLENGLNLWIVADNLRKGAATNAVQIAEYLIEHKLV
ncbi:aspartate-semialdehyde dehydrogenase [Psychroflexus sp. ALD_RP9]|uniref:aspartate-semialdehyde dehydrogenase n=1 Tax=Psychroflexus sp. ALD_RP9 TaxID=2777186 RepID=UPI001A90BE33|nr:aspartate-semialdehyde dehydrogenase [Psychroflexus sp. ALD_RP9]QSS96206.1 aspartate-semialdehyde dehydrogenase [Psychroflexus sp. ALD_RP9]